MTKASLLAAVAAWAMFLPETAFAQDENAPAADGKRTFLPADFERFAPKNALDMLNQIPGFRIVSQEQGRGLGQASDNVVVNGERLASKSDSLWDQLARITADRVERIEIVDGATLGIPGLSGEVANIFTRESAISGRFEYRMNFRPKYAEPSWIGGEVSASGSTPRLEWTLALTHGTGRGAASGPGIITDGLGNLTENRDVHIRFVGEYPRIAGTLKWDGPGSMAANFNANYSKTYSDFSNDEKRDLVSGTDLLRDFDNRTRGYGYEIGGDLDFALGPGRLKLIGLERFNHTEIRAQSFYVYQNASPTTGDRFTLESDSGERIGRAEYRWDMLGGNWQLDAEAAFNRLEQEQHLYFLDTGGEFAEIPFPGSSGGVTEDRYEVILNHNRTLSTGLTMQLGAGGEYSKLAQTDAGGLVREFWRPKGSLTLAWTPKQGLDLSLKIARTIGQLAFTDFLAAVNLAQETQNASNALLVPQQEWGVDLEVRKDLKAWGSANLRLYGRSIEDGIDIIPVAGGLEARGNIEGKATLYGVSANATINLDPIGWKGAKINANASVEETSLKDPLTGIDRPWSDHNAFGGEVSLRWDVPGSDWAMGAGFQWTDIQPYVRLFEVGRDYEGPVYSWAFIEHKDMLGMTVKLNVFNLTNGRGRFDRTVYDGYRDTAPILYREKRNLSVQPIFQLTVRGTF